MPRKPNQPKLAKYLNHTFKCSKCAKGGLVPDETAKNFTTDEWDGHTFKLKCNCLNIRISIG